jgi:hypothetical protein
MNIPNSAPAAKAIRASPCPVWKVFQLKKPVCYPPHCLAEVLENKGEKPIDLPVQQKLASVSLLTRTPCHRLYASCLSARPSPLQCIPALLQHDAEKPFQSGEVANLAAFA